MTGNDDALVLNDDDGGLRAEHVGGLLDVQRGVAVRNAADVTQVDVGLRNGAGVELRVGAGESHDCRRMGNDDGADFRMLVVDALMQHRRAAGGLARFAHAVLDAHDVFRLQILSVLHVGSDQEGAVGQTLGEGALRAVEQALIIGTMDQGAHLAAGFAFLAGDLAGNEGVQRGDGLAVVDADLSLGQGTGGA